MADTTTTTLSLTKPEVGASADTWGTKINTNLDTIDGLFTTGPALLATKGGTGQTSYAVGDLLYASTSSALSKLADVATGSALISGGVGVAPSWGKVGLTTHISGTLAAGNGGTGIGTYVIGDLLYASTTSALSALAATAAGRVLISNGTGTAPSWSATPLVTSIDIGAADTTISKSAAGVIAVEGVDVPTISSTSTLTNKRVTPRMTSTTSTASPWAWNSDGADIFAFTALANNLTINADAGTPTDGQRVILRFKPNTAVTLTFTTGTTKSFRAIGTTLPTSLVSGKTTYVGCVYNSADSRWDVIATGTEA